MKISDLPKSSRPRERFLEFGKESLSDAELLAIILRTGTKKENVVEMSNRLISKYNLEKLFSCSIEELSKIKGIGISKAIQLLVISEIAKRVNQSKKEKVKITCSKDVFDMFQDKLRNETKEHFYTVLLNTKNKIIKTEKISTGILDASIIHPREIFKEAIKSSAARIILVHNHPSGDPSPSEEDIEITRKLIDSGDLIGIEVLDHVIIGEETFWSYTE